MTKQVSKTPHGRSCACLGHILAVCGLLFSSILACAAPGVSMPPSPTIARPNPGVTVVMSTPTVRPTVDVIKTGTPTPLPLRTRTQTPSKVPMWELPTILPSATFEVYVVRAGDTLIEIASRLCGDGEQWRRLAQLNALSDPNHIQVGTTLRIDC